MTTEAESFQVLMLCICSAFFLDQWCVLSEMNLSSIVSCLISYLVHCIRPLWRILQSSLVLIMLEFQEVCIYVKNLGIQLCSILPSPLYQAIMENPLVQLSFNNARILGGMYIRQKLGNSIMFHFALCQFCFSNKEVKM